MVLTIFCTKFNP